jgi:hypothetical protein
VLALGCGRRAYDDTVDGGEADDAGDIDAPDTPSQLASGDLRILFGQGPTDQVQLITLRPGQSPSTVAIPVGTQANTWVKGVAASVLREHVAVQSDLGATTRLEVASRTGATWASDFTVDIPRDTDVQVFDLAMESQSGDVLVVYSDGGATPVYRTFSAGAWSAPAFIPINGVDGGPELTAAPVDWVRLEARQRFDEVALVFSANEDLVAMVWSGTEWRIPSANQLSGNLLRNGARSFDVAYEGGSGDLLVAHANLGVTGMFSNLKTANVDTWEAPKSFQTGTNFNDFVVLGADPASNHIVLSAFSMGAAGAFAALWSDTQWLDIQAYQTSARSGLNGSQMPTSATFLGQSSTGILLAADAPVGRIASESHETVGGFSAASELDLASGSLNSIRAISTGDNSMMVFIADSEARLFGADFTDLTWTTLESGQPLATDLASVVTAPFAVHIIP